HDSFENVYISANFRTCDEIHVVQDSDEFSILSLTPEATNYSPPPPAREDRRGFRWRREYERMCDIRRSLECHAVANRDSVRQVLFRKPIRWHAGQLDAGWQHEEARIEKLFERAIGDCYREGEPTDRSGFNWRTVLLDRPIFEWPSIARGFVYR